MNRTSYLEPPEPSERQQLLAQAGTGDLELTDLYNAVEGTLFPSPLSIEHLRWAVGLKIKGDRQWIK